MASQAVYAESATRQPEAPTQLVATQTNFVIEKQQIGIGRWAEWVGDR